MTSATAPSPFRVHAALFIVAALFSINYIISKLGMRAFHPLTFAYLRVLGAALVLRMILPPGQARLEPSDSRSLTLFSLLGVVLNQTLFLGGLSMTSAHVAALLITTIPVFTLAVAILKGREAATGAKIAGIAIAAAGALLVLGGESLTGTRRSAIGAALLIGNCLCYALYLVLSKPMMARLSARRVVSRMFTIGSVLMLPVAALPLTRERWTEIPPEAWASLILVIAGPTVMAYLINAWSLRFAASSLVASYVYVQPFLTAILAALFLHERIRPVIALAAALIFGGVYLAGRPAPPAATGEAIPGSQD